MPELDFESDVFLNLLTDALRAGPGSPAWHEALRRLRAGGIEGADEYRLLTVAREHLESGKEYRSVRAGPGFAERLSAALDAPARPRRALPSASTIAFASAAILLIACGLIGYLLWNATDHSGGTSGGRLLLPVTVASTDFSSALNTADWQIIGKLPLDLGHGTMKVITDNSAGSLATGGGVLWRQPFNASDPFAIAATLRVHHTEDDLIAQVFLTDRPQFGEDNSTTSHELVWLVQGQHVQVLPPNGRIEGGSELPTNWHGNLYVRIFIDHSQASVDFNGKTIWTGAHGLDPDKPLYAGARFLRKSDKAGEGVTFQLLRINKRQQP